MLPGLASSARCAAYLDYLYYLDNLNNSGKLDDIDHNINNTDFINGDYITNDIIYHDYSAHTSATSTSALRAITSASSTVRAFGLHSSLNIVTPDVETAGGY